MKKQQVLPLGPFKGVRDSGDAGKQSPHFLQDAINGFFTDPRNGGTVEARPGFARNTLSSLATTNGFVQCIHGMPAANGDFYVFAIVDGKVYRQNSSVSTTWTDVSPVGITINTTPRVYAVNYNEEIIFSEGVNRPWRATNLSTTPITGTYIQVDTASSAWTARGSPTVYSGKLFFIRSGYGSRIVWSEELSAATGYVQDGYTNYWDLVQTGSDRLLAILGTNAALYYFRERSIGEVLGAANVTFSTSSSHDSVDQEIGLYLGVSSSMCPPIVARGYVWFLGPDAGLYRFRIGSRAVEPLWQQMARRIKEIRGGSGVNDLVVARMKIAYSRDLNLIAVLAWQEPVSPNSNEAQNIYLFDADTGNYTGRWQVEVPTQAAAQSTTAGAGIMEIEGVQIASSLTDFGQSTFMLGGSLPSTNTGGNIWRQALQRRQTFGDNSAAMHQSITTMLTPDDENVEFKIDEVALEVLPDTTAVSLDYYTPRGSKLALTATGVASSDSIQSSYDHGICRFGLGATASGRWWRGVFYRNVAAGTTPHAFEKGSLKVRTYPLSPFAP